MSKHTQCSSPVHPLTRAAAPRERPSGPGCRLALVNRTFSPAPSQVADVGSCLIVTGRLRTLSSHKPEGGGPASPHPPWTSDHRWAPISGTSLSCLWAQRAAWKPSYLESFPLLPGRAKASPVERVTCKEVQSIPSTREQSVPWSSHWFLVNRSMTRNTHRRIFVAVVLKYASHLHWMKILP